MKYVCDVCGWEYDESEGYPEGGIAPGTRWEDIRRELASRHIIDHKVKQEKMTK